MGTPPLILSGVLETGDNLMEPMGTGMDASAACYGMHTALKAKRLFRYSIPDTLLTNETELRKKLRMPRCFQHNTSL